jgi:phospholipid/cholesterol/gamma-HCH transport system permease protein
MPRALTGIFAHARGEEPPPSWRIEKRDGDIRIIGRLRTADASAIVAALRDATADTRSPSIDLGGIEQIDGGVISLLRSDFAARGVRPMLHGGERFRALFELYAQGVPAPAQMRKRGQVAAEVGRAAIMDVAGAEEALSFIGDLALSSARHLRTGARNNWKELPSLIERAGFDALPVVLTINFLIGFVMAYMTTLILTTFGANQFVADLVGIAMTRQLGPLMTAFVVCGRSGAAFATELGSMRVSEEIDALRTMGLEPYGWLVFPRVLSLVLVLPVLTLLADIAGIFGGLVVGTVSLGLTARGFYTETVGAIFPWDVESGLIMSVAFALAIGLIACQQGFAASGGPLGVGRRTTNTVVASLFAIVLLDAMFTVLYRTLHLS